MVKGCERVLVLILVFAFERFGLAFLDESFCSIPYDIAVLVNSFSYFFYQILMT